jgi:DNA-binding response OmpR family regulator
VTATLLAVDDSKTMRKVIEITFAGENYRTVLADSPADAMAKLRAEKPTVAIVDALLGTASGYELCQQIKAESPQVGVIVLGSKQHPYDRVKGNAVGADDFLDKPYDTQALLDKTAALVQKMASAPAARAFAAPTTAARPAPVVVPSATGPAAASATRQPTQSVSFGAPAAARLAPAASGAGMSPAQSAVPGRAGSGLFGGPASSSAQAAAGQPTQASRAASATTSQSAMARLSAAQPAAVVQPAAAHPTAAQPAVATAAVAAAQPLTALIDAPMETKLAALGLTKDQITGVVALSREVVEQVVWEVVPVLAETMIREEIKRLVAS